jgi:hypothetical protein
MQYAKREERGYDVCKAVCAPEIAQADRKLFDLVEITQVQNHIRNEPTFDNPKKTPGEEECSFAVKMPLRAGHNAPQYHLNRYPVVGTKLFTDKLPVKA